MPTIFDSGWLAMPHTAAVSRPVVSISTGPDSAPFSGTAPAASQLEFDPETVDAWEIGTKGMLLDAVQLNIALSGTSLTTSS